VIQAAWPAPAEAPRGWTKSCGRCRRSYGPSQWSELPVIECLPAAAVQSHMSVPAAWTVELRPCACGAMLAATTRVRADR
jgi:hypothetical protein